MAQNELTSLSDAMKLALSILEPFRDSSLYDDYQDVDGWTDEQFQSALEILYEACDREELAGEDFFVVEGAQLPSPSG